LPRYIYYLIFVHFVEQYVVKMFIVQLLKTCFANCLYGVYYHNAILTSLFCFYTCHFTVSTEPGGIEV